MQLEEALKRQDSSGMFYTPKRARLWVEQFRKLLTQLRRDAETRVFKRFTEIVALTSAMSDVTDSAFAAQFTLCEWVLIIAIHESRLG